MDQYDEWTPHLTLGYPEAPAREKEDDDNYMGYVHFDRVAIWVDDFSGPEFRLKYADLQDTAVMMSEMTTAQRGEQAVAELFHFGVKGMKWGVRKSEASGGSSGSAGRGKIRRGITKASVSLDAGAKVIREGEKKLIFLPLKNRQDAASRTQTRMLAAARRVNKDPRYKGKDIKNNPRLKRSYYDRLQEEAKTIYAEELNISRTEAWGEFLNIDTSMTTNQMRINAAVDKIKHDDEDLETLLVLDFDLDENGLVKDMALPPGFLEHSELAHRNVSTEERKELKKKGAAKPDLSFPIANAEDLTSAIRLAKSDSDRLHVIKNAKRLGLEDKIPDTWNADGSLKHSNDSDLVVMHYGVKGMKWGVTTRDGATAATQTREKTSHLVRGAKDVEVSQRKAGTYVKAKGGQRQKAHEDAVRAQAGRQIAKKSTTDALSNKQLKETIERMRLEQEFSKLDSKVQRKGQSFIARLFRSPEMREVAADLSKRVAAKAGT